MKNQSWLNVAEYLMLVGSGVGSVATAMSQQFLYAAAPLSVLMLLNLANHRRLAETAAELTETAVSQLDQKLSGTLRLLQQQIQTLPSPLHLASLRQDLQAKNQEAFDELSQRIDQVQRELADPKWRSLPRDTAQLQAHYSGVATALIDLRASLQRLETTAPVSTTDHDIEQIKAELALFRDNLHTLSSEHRFNQYRALQDQIVQVNRRLNNLPAPFDASALKQDVDSLIKVMGEFASRRDLSRVEARIEQLSQHNSDLEQYIVPLRTVTTIIKRQMDTVAAKVTQLEIEPSQRSAAVVDQGAIDRLQTAVSDLEQRVEQLPALDDLSTLRTEVSTQVGQLQQKFEAVQYQTQELDREQKTLRNWVNYLPQLLDTSALHNEVKYLATRVEWAEGTVADLQIHAEATRKPSPTHVLVFDVQKQAAAVPSPSPRGSRAMLAEALTIAQARLIVVVPFANPDTFDDALFQDFQRFLERKGCLDLGLGRLGNQTDWQRAAALQNWADSAVYLPRSLERQHGSGSATTDFLYPFLNQLTALKKQYPERFRLKVLGTNEHFLVCDRAYAVLGTPEIATASVVFPQAVAGLQTTDPAVIQGLVERFDHPSLDPQDAVAYFHRASSCYQLGDRAGAIADYTHLITLHPDHAVIFNNRGAARFELGDHEGAIADLSEAIQHSPNPAIAYCNRGFIRSELDDKLGAIADYTDALRLNPNSAIAYFYRGLARTRMQNRLGAIQDYTQVIRLTPQNATAYFYRGLACAKLGHRLEAIRDLRQAAHLFKLQGDIAHYRQTLSAINKLDKLTVAGGAGKAIAVTADRMNG